MTPIDELPRATRAPLAVIQGNKGKRKLSTESRSCGIRASSVYFPASSCFLHDVVVVVAMMMMMMVVVVVVMVMVVAVVVVVVVVVVDNALLFQLPCFSYHYFLATC